MNNHYSFKKLYQTVPLVTENVFHTIKIFTKNLGKSLRNQIFYVKIERIENDYCVGEIVSEQ